METEHEKNAVSVDFTDIIQKLNRIALDAVRKSGIRFVIDNTAFDKSGDKFYGPGGHAIAVTVEQGDGEQNFQKNRFFDILKEYLGYLFGENFKNQVRKDYLQDISKIPPVQKQENSQQDQEQNGNNALEENLFISQADRFVGNVVEMLMESEDGQDKNAEPQTIGIGINYNLKVNGDSGMKYENAIVKRGGVFCGRDSNTLSMSGMGGTARNPSRFNPCFTATSQEILTNLHDSAAKNAAKKLGIKADRNINQYIVNTGITYDGTTISDFGSTMKSEHRFKDNHDMFVGVIQEVEGKNDQDGPGESTRRIDEARKKAFGSLSEYFRWFCGKQDLSEDQLEQFSPRYRNGKVEISDGDVVQGDQTQNSEQGDDKDNREMIGFKVRYSVRYGK